MSIVLRGPAKVIDADLLPAPVFAEAVLRSDEVVVGRHTAGKGLVQPHPCLVRILRGISPADDTGGIRRGDISGKFAVEYGIADSALEAASPHRRIIVGAALVVGLVPRGDLSQPVKIWAAAHVAAKIGKEKAVRLLLLCDCVVFLPEFKHSVVEHAPISRSSRRRQLAADRAMAFWQAPDRRPSIGIEAVHIVERVDLTHDCGHIVVHVGGEHARLEQTRFFAAELHGAIFVAHGPLRMSRERVTPIQVGAHASHRAHSALFGCSHAFAKEIAPVQVLSVTMELHLRRVIRQNSGDADKDNVGLGAMPVVGPFLDVHDGGIVLCHVALTNAADPLLPGFAGWIEMSHARRQ